jgi:hypothetical protein
LNSPQASRGGMAARTLLRREGSSTVKSGDTCLVACRHSQASPWHVPLPPALAGGKEVYPMNPSIVWKFSDNGAKMQGNRQRRTRETAGLGHLQSAYPNQTRKMSFPSPGGRESDRFYPRVRLSGSASSGLTHFFNFFFSLFHLNIVPNIIQTNT